MAREISLDTESGKRIINSDNPYIIAEIGGNHDGDIEKAFLMIEKAAECGADCAKFQIFKTEELFDKESEAYPAVKGYKTQFERMKSIELDFNDFKKIKSIYTRHCHVDQSNIEIFSLFDQ